MNPKKLEMIYEGKAKKVYATSDPDSVIFSYKDDATAFNGQKFARFEGKGVLNNAISTLMFERLQVRGVRSHFIRKLSDRDQLCRRVEIVPLEVVVRNRATGSMAKRMGLDDGMRLATTVLELCYKRDELGDPVIGEYHAVGAGIATFAEIEAMYRTARIVNTEMQEIFSGIGIELIDFKIEFGRLPADRVAPDEPRLVLADEISPDTCRLWDAKTGERLDKDRFRRDLAPLLDGYREILERLEQSRIQ